MHEWRLVHETNLLGIVNPSLAYIYCSTTWSNHKLIRFNKFSRELASVYIISFIIILYLILLIGV